MTGAVMTLLGATVPSGGGGGGGGGGTLGALNWPNIYSDWSGTTPSLAIAGITSFHSLTATKTGTGALLYVLNGTIKPYTGAINVNAGDTLGWQINNTVINTTKSGLVTINDASNGGALVDTFNYSVSASNF